MDPKAPMDSHGLRPVLHYQSKSRIEDKVRKELGKTGLAPEAGPWERGGRSPSQGCSVPQAQILLDCGEDNICVPDLQLDVYG